MRYWEGRCTEMSDVAADPDGQRVLIDEPGDVRSVQICGSYARDNVVSLVHGDRLVLLQQIPDEAAQLVVTSPPYNIGKEYEKRTDLEGYVADQEATIREAYRILAPNGSICWQVGNHIAADGEVHPLDIVLYPVFRALGLRLRNRIIWHFEHGLHCSKRFSGRHEAVLWFTKSDDYVFDLDAVRVAQKYPGKRHFKGPNAGQLSGNPLGKNPGDVWTIPNVKANHIEKTEHPCQFPVELVERLVLSMTQQGALVVDPYVGVGSTAVAALRHRRRSAGSDTEKRYLDIARRRLQAEAAGTLRTRPLGKPVYEPSPTSRLAQRPLEWDDDAGGEGGE